MGCKNSLKVQKFSEMPNCTSKYDIEFSAFILRFWPFQRKNPTFKGLLHPIFIN
jgi:hypothetical protein